MKLRKCQNKDIFFKKIKSPHGGRLYRCNKNETNDACRQQFETGVPNCSKAVLICDVSSSEGICPLKIIITLSEPCLK